VIRRDQKIQEIGLIAQEKLNDKEFNTVIDAEFKIQVIQIICVVKSGINISFFRQNLLDYDDKIIYEFLEFGAPIGFKGTLLEDDNTDIVNHKGAREFDDDVLKYLFKEASHGVIIGPFDKNPFPDHFKILPLHTVSKKHSLDRRVNLDLNFHAGNSVNDFISKDNYLGEIIQLPYPKVDDLVGIIKDKGANCLVFKKDLKRAYRQIPIDPGDLHLFGFQWGDKLFTDRALPMGLRSSAQICQRITTAVSFIYYKMGYMVVNYLDDLGGAETLNKACDAYDTLGGLLAKCGLEEAVQKGVAPTTRMEVLGITVDTVKLTIEVTPDRVTEISLLVEAWLRKKRLLCVIYSHC
jgi:hypothetical protein